MRAHTHKYAADLTLHNLILALPNTKLLTFMRHHISYSYSLRKSYCHACHLLHSSRFRIARLHPATHTCARAHTRTQYKMEITSSGKFHLGQADITSRPFLSSKVIHKCTRAHTATNLLIQKHMCRGRALAAALQRRRKKGGHWTNMRELTATKWKRCNSDMKTWNTYFTFHADMVFFLIYFITDLIFVT